MNDVIIVKTDPILKSKAQKTASGLGLSLSAVIKRYLETFIETKSISFGEDANIGKTLYGIFPGSSITEDEINKITSSWQKAIGKIG